ncbi:MAG: ABATE domain-containing protein [Myxococcales bacterium]
MGAKVSQGGEPFLWLGEHLALDFLNTEPMLRGQRVELLATFEDLVHWCTVAGLLTPAAARHVLQRWGPLPAGRRNLNLAQGLRSEIRIALEARSGTAPSRRAVRFEVLNRCLRRGGTSPEVRQGREMPIGGAAQDDDDFRLGDADVIAELADEPVVLVERLEVVLQLDHDLRAVQSLKSRKRSARPRPIGYSLNTFCFGNACCRNFASER